MTRKLFENYGITVVAEPFKVRGGKTEEYIRLLQPNFVVVLAISDNGVLLERQFRRGVNKYITELQAGFIERGEKPAATAKRELREETGYEPRKVKLMFKGYEVPTRTTSTIYFYLAEGLTKKKKKLDNSESITSKFVSIKKFESMIRNNTIKDQKTIIAYLYYCRYFGKQNPKR